MSAKWKVPKLDSQKVARLLELAEPLTLQYNHIEDWNSSLVLRSMRLICIGNSNAGCSVRLGIPVPQCFLFHVSAHVVIQNREAG
jgi:hypothetical protein